MRRLVIVAIAFLLTGCSVLPRETVTVPGNASGKSAPFHLNGGSYRVDWTLTDNNPSRLTCGFAGRMVNTAGTASHPLGGGEMERGQSTKSGVTYAYNVTPDEYVIDVLAICDWSFVLTQQ